MSVVDGSTSEEFFGDQDLARELYCVVLRAVVALGPANVRVSKSQIAFRRGRSFAAVWMPRVYLGERAAPLVLTIFLPFRDTSSRWKQVIEPAPGRYTHHLELRHPRDVDEDVERWLRQAWEAAA